MVNNFRVPFVGFEESLFRVVGDSSSFTPLGQELTMLPNYYGTGFVQIHHELNIESEIEPGANIGSVLDESAIRRSLGTFHTEQDGYVDRNFVIEYPRQRFTWEGQKYPFERSNAADPGWMVPREKLGLDFILDADIPVKVDPFSLTLLTIPIPGSNPPRTRTISPVPQYKVEKSCLRLILDTQRLSLNNFQPASYKTLDKLRLFFDSDGLVVRPRIGVTMNCSYESFVVIASEDTPVTEVRGGGTFGVCVPILPVYPPQPPDGPIDTSPN
jgi:hypothetical protein